MVAAPGCVDRSPVPSQIDAEIEPEPNCGNPTDGLLRIGEVSDELDLALHLVRVAPTAFVFEPGQAELSLEEPARRLVRGAMAQLLRQWATRERAGATSEGAPRVAELQRALDELVENSAQTGGEYRWFASESELFPIGGAFALANQEWLSFARLVRGGTNCVGQMLLMAELAGDNVEVTAVGDDGHWMNQMVSGDSEFWVDSWSDVPPYAAASSAGVLSWAEAQQLARQGEGRPTPTNLFLPDPSSERQRICTSADWEYEGEATIDQIAALPDYLPGDERELALTVFLNARVHQLYGDSARAWQLYLELHEEHCAAMNPDGPDRTVVTFCRASVTHMGRLRPDEAPCADCWWAGRDG